jgi:hypothetical protein
VANLGAAIAYFDAALRVYTEQGFPVEHMEAAEGLSSARATLANLQVEANNNPVQ